MSKQKNKKKNYCVIFGGISEDHEVVGPLTENQANYVCDHDDRGHGHVFPLGGPMCDVTLDKDQEYG